MVSIIDIRARDRAGRTFNLKKYNAAPSKVYRREYTWNTTDVQVASPVLVVKRLFYCCIFSVSFIFYFNVKLQTSQKIVQLRHRVPISTVAVPLERLIFFSG